MIPNALPVIWVLLFFVSLAVIVVGLVWIISRASWARLSDEQPSSDAAAAEPSDDRDLSYGLPGLNLRTSTASHACLGFGLAGILCETVLLLVACTSLQSRFSLALGPDGLFVEVFLFCAAPVLAAASLWVGAYVKESEPKRHLSRWGVMLSIITICGTVALFIAIRRNPPFP
jgi:hypothetical protein